jgi:hypothetical protein
MRNHIALLSTASVMAFAGTAKAKTEETAPATDTNAATDAAPAETVKARRDNEAAQIGAVSKAVPMPASTPRGTKSRYPFDDLTEVGMSIPVLNKTAAQLRTLVSQANSKNKVKKTDAAGNVIFKTTEVRDAEGNVTGRTPTSEPEMVAGKVFFASDCNPETDPDKAMARIFRKI